MPQKEVKRTEEPEEKHEAGDELPDVVGLSHKKGSSWMKYALAGALAFEAATSSLSAATRPNQRARQRPPAGRVAVPRRNATPPKAVYVPGTPARQLTPDAKATQEEKLAEYRQEHERSMKNLDKQMQYEGALKKVQNLTSRAVKVNSRETYIAAAEIVRPIAEGDGFTQDQKSGAYYTLGSVYLNGAKMTAPEDAGERQELLKKAEEACKQGVEGFPSNSHTAGTWNTLGKVHAEQGKLEEAHKDQIKALQLGGPNDEAVFDAAKEIQRLESLMKERKIVSRGWAEEERRQESQINQLKSAADNTATAPEKRAKALYELGNAHYDFAMKDSSNNMTNAVKHLDSSRQALDRFVTENPKDDKAPGAYYRLGEIYRMEQNGAKSKESFQLARESAKIHHNKAVAEMADRELR